MEGPVFTNVTRPKPGASRRRKGFRSCHCLVAPLANSAEGFMPLDLEIGDAYASPAFCLKHNRMTIASFCYLGLFLSGSVSKI